MNGRFVRLEVLVGKLDWASIRILATSNLGVAVSGISGWLRLLIAS